MKIAFIGIKGLPPKGGAERVVEAIVQRLRSRHEITVYCSSRYTPPQSSVCGIKLVRIPGLAGKHAHMTSVDLLAAWHAVLYGDYDLIHVHNIEACFVLPLLKLRYPVVSTAHGRITPDSKWSDLSAKLMRAMEMPYARFSDIATSVSLPDSVQLAANLGKPVLHLPNGVNARAALDTEAARKVLKSHDLQAHGYILFAADRVIPLKGAHLVLDALQRIRQDYRLVIIGNLDHAPHYASQIRSMADARTTFLPFQSSKETLWGLIQLSRFFVFPSTAEAMSMMLLEAASAGAPILCSKIPANTAVLDRHALYFSPGNVCDLADKLSWCLEHPKEMQESGTRAKAWVEKRFSWDLISDQYDRAYHGALAIAKTGLPRSCGAHTPFS